jgi:hypothetical protein
MNADVYRRLEVLDRYVARLVNAVAAHAEARRLSGSCHLSAGDVTGTLNDDLCARCGDQRYCQADVEFLTTIKKIREDRRWEGW